VSGLAEFDMLMQNYWNQRNLQNAQQKDDDTMRKCLGQQKIQ
jgi:hypothetical protein